MLNPLLVPCRDRDACEAALASGAVALMLDLGENATGARAAARHAAADFLARRRGATAIVRLAPLASGLVDADLDVVMPGAPEAVLLPGAVGGRDLQHLGAKLAVREAEHGLPPGRTRIAAAPADTAPGVLALPTLAGASLRLMALAWEAAALARALGVETDASPVQAARDLLILAAAAAGVPALDCSVGEDDVAEACSAARRAGFAGRLARRPEELAIMAEVLGHSRPDRARPPR